MIVERPKVGVGVLLFNSAGQILLGKRVNGHGFLTWGPAGGHLEYSETFKACALRELHEEAGIVATDASFIGVTNDLFSTEQKHYVTVFMRVECPVDQAPIVCEPDKTVEWGWFSLQELPQPLFLPLANIIKQL